MERFLVYPIGVSDSCRFASGILQQSGCHLIDHPSPEVTHLLLDIPSFNPGGFLQNGSDLKTVLQMLPDSLTVIGGNLNIPGLETYRKIDLLKDPYYLARNAAITAECALRFCDPYLKTTFADASVLILGWGRIGKCLARLLKAMGTSVTVAARKESDRAMLEALGYGTVDFLQISDTLKEYTVLFNTVPDSPLAGAVLEERYHGIAIDLASYPGMRGRNVIAARGLPGKYAPESSGKLIAQTILRLWKEELS